MKNRRAISHLNKSAQFLSIGGLSGSPGCFPTNSGDVDEKRHAIAHLNKSAQVL